MIKPVYLMAVLLAVTAPSSVVFAQTPVPGAGDILRSTKEKPESPTQGAPVLPDVKQADERPAMSLGEDIKITVNAFTVSGNTAIDSATIVAALAEDIGKELDAGGLANAARKARRVYTSRGYFLAVAYLPQQEIKSGVVEIAIIEGRLGEIKVSVAPGASITESQARAIIDAHLKSGDLITEAALERPLLLIRDMAGVDAKSTIDPGQQVGTADISVAVVPDQSGRQVSGRVDLDNNGNRFAGEHRIGASVLVSSPLGLGDRLSLRAQIAEQVKTNVASANYVLPVGPFGTKVALSAAQLYYTLGQNEFAGLGAHGDAAIYGFNVIHPVFRRRDANVFVRLGYEETSTRDFLKVTLAPDRKKIPATTLEVSGDLFDSNKGYTFGSLTYVEGRTKFLNATNLAVDQNSGKTSGGFSKVAWSIKRLQQLPADFFLELAASGQVASKNLTPLMKFSLGGPTGVRAYPVGDASGDNGELYSLELRRVVPGVTLLGNAITGSVFYDAGRVEQNANLNDIPAAVPRNKQGRGGYGFGLSGGNRDTLLMRLSVAWPDAATPAADQNDKAKRDPRAYFSVLKAF